MAEKDPETAPSLELPSLFGRRKRRTEQSGGDTTTVTHAEPSSAPGDTATVPRVEDPPHDAGEATAVIPAVESEPAPRTEPAPAPREPAAPPAAHAPPVTPVAVPSPTPPVPSPTRPAPRRAAATPVSTGATPARAGGRRRARAGSRSMPEVAAATAALLVGAIVGLVGCVLTYLGLQGCELVTGTTSCGGPGLLVLAVILVVMVLLGAVMLKALGVPEAGNVSFLGVGVLAVVALLFLIEYLYDPWMFVVVPVVTAISFALARWVTTLYAEDVLDDDRDMPRHDIR